MKSVDSYSIALFLLFISLVSLILDLQDENTSKCVDSHHEILYVLVIHHIFDTFLYFGWLFNEKIILLIYILTVIFIMIYWILNANRCDMTLYVDKICGWNNDVMFNDFFARFGLKSYDLWNNFGNYLLLIFLALFCVHKYVYL